MRIGSRGRAVSTLKPPLVRGYRTDIMKDPPGPHDHRFLRIREALDGHAPQGEIPRAEASRPRDARDPEGRIQAAVSLVLRSRNELEVLLIKRAEVERDPWSGHMALPGGRREPLDRTLTETAVRETAEETGLELGESGLWLGRLHEVLPESRQLPSISITPFVFGVPRRAVARADSREVDAVLWVPLSRFRDPEARGTLSLEVRGGVREFPGFQVQAGLVWGLTYRILTRFLAVVPWSAETGPPDSPPTPR